MQWATDLLWAGGARWQNTSIQMEGRTGLGKLKPIAESNQKQGLNTWEYLYKTEEKFWNHKSLSFQ